PAPTPTPEHTLAGPWGTGGAGGAERDEGPSLLQRRAGWSGGVRPAGCRLAPSGWVAGASRSHRGTIHQISTKSPPNLRQVDVTARSPGTTIAVHLEYTGEQRRAALQVCGYRRRAKRATLGPNRGCFTSGIGDDRQLASCRQRCAPPVLVAGSRRRLMKV